MSASNVGAAATAASNNNASSSNKESIDLDLYSRQLYVLGLDTLISLSKTNVLILGLKGLGAEVAKNLILAGPNSVHVHDDNLAEISDLSSQFYLTESDVGKKRSLSCVNRLSELNPYVKVKAIEGEITADIVKNYQIVVDTNTTSFESAQKLNALCRSVGVRSIFSATFGLYGFCFVDFVGGGADLAEEFVVTDHSGEEYAQLVVSSIASGNPTTVHVHEEKRHGLETGDWIIFEDLEGFSEINDGKPLEVIVKGPHSFELKDVDSTNFKPFIRGFVRQAKKPVKVKFDSLAYSIEHPGEFLLSDFGKFGRAEQLHIALRALLAFSDKNGSFPRSHNKEDAAQVIALAKEINEKAKKTEGAHSVDEIEESLVEKLAATARGNLNPTAAFFGGIIAQEVLKISGKFHPIKQWFHFEAFECLPDTIFTNVELTNTRYDGQIAVFGREFQTALLNTHAFLVGCGALGCEFLKNFALMGLACGENGMLHVTDMDNIEKSNLNRQFLFRDKNIGQMKAIAATAAAQEMNKSLKITARTDAVGADTEHIFNEEFWNSQDIIVNALDNIKARLYVDSCCVIHKKPLFESGTLGTKANTQVILPYKTESYGSTRDPPESAIPMCTLKNFPYQIEHTIEWARDYFGGVFTFGISEVNNYLKNPEEFFTSLKTSQPHIATQRETLTSINETLLAIKKGVDFSYCVEWARLKFEDLFVNKIKQLLFNFPVEHRDASGQLFWSGLKRAPKPLIFNPEEPTHFSFILAASNLLAHAYGVKGSTDPSEIKKILAGVKVILFEPRGGVVIKESETSTAVEGGSDDIEVVERLTKEIPLPSSFPTNFQLVPEQFEKDDDSNFHIDFITAASNLRATNYEIREADRNKTKQIAGKIIPAIATTTAMITGLVCMEIYKYLQKKPLDAFRNAFVNLALPLFAFSEPVEPQKHTSQTKTEPHTRAVPEGWTLWDTLVVEGDLTFQELIDYFKSKYQLNVTSVAAGTSLIYNAYIPKYKARLPMKISEVWKTICGDNWDPSVKTVDMSVETELEEDDTIEVDLPVVRVKFC